MGDYAYYTYDPIGRLIRTKYNEGETDYEYDTFAVGKIAREYSTTSGSVCLGIILVILN